MTLLTPTPEVRDYVVAIVTVGGLSCPWLAGAIHARYLRGRPAAYLPCYVTVMGLLCVIATVVIEHGVRLPSGAALLWSAPAGLLGGGLVVWGETRLRRRLQAHEQRRRARRPPPAPVSARATVGLDRSGGALVRPDLGPNATSRVEVTTLLVLVAILEELIFRGILLRLALGVPLVGAGAVVLLTLVFALTHVQFGWREVAGKLPLGVVATGLALGTGAVVGPAMCHVFVNVHAAR